MGCVTSLSGHGLRDWLWQRLTAIYMVIYFKWLILYCVALSPINHTVWQQLFAGRSVKIATLLCFMSLLPHTWIGMWTVATDYIKPLPLRLLYHGWVLLTLLICFFWAIDVLWSQGTS